MEMSRLFWRVFLLPAVLLVVFLAGCGGESSSDTGTPSATESGASSSTDSSASDQQDAEDVEIVAVAPVPLFALATYAEQQGLFPESVDVSVKFVSSPVANPLVAGGKAQFGISGNPNFDLLAAEGVPVKWLAVYNTFPDLQFVACCDINSVSELEGTTIGITGPGTLGAILTNVMLEESGLEPSDVKLASLGTLGAMQGAMTGHQINGLLSSPPAPQQIAKSLPGSKIIYDFSKTKLDWFGAGIAGYMPWVEDHPEATEAVLQGLNAAVVKWPTDPKGAKAAISAYAEITDPAELQSSWEVVNRDITKTLEPVSQKTEENVLSILRDNGFPEASADLAGQLTAPEYVERAVPESSG